MKHVTVIQSKLKEIENDLSIKYESLESLTESIDVLETQKVTLNWVLESTNDDDLGTTY
jgi:hypothetical protein